MDERIVELLRDLDSSPDILVRGEAADALGEIGPAAHGATPHLLSYLPLPAPGPWSQSPGLPEWYFFVRVAYALWQIEGDPTHLLSVGLEAIRHPVWLVRDLAVRRLGDLGAVGQPAAALLRQRLQDEHPVVRKTARAALEKIGATA